MGIIRLLDCTLRDGGHINKGKFGKNVIKAIIEDLVKAKIDIIEAGFLWNTETDADTAKFSNLDKLKKYLPEDMGHSKVSLMADNIDLSDLEPYNGTVEYIRLSFRKNEIDWVERNVKILMEKGYKCYINPIHASSISDQEYLQIVDRVNKIKPYGFSIVDTFGAMRQSDLGRIYYLIENNLDKDIILGVHLHENLGLAYSLAQYILNIVAPTRDITIDGSLYGMGKVPGNLCIEQMLDYMNSTYKGNYSTEPVYDAIDNFIMPIRKKNVWGYSIPYAISAQCSVHRTYAEYLTEKDRLKTKDIRRLLKMIDQDNAETFNETYIADMYNRYMGAKYEDSVVLKELEKLITLYNRMIIIAPGSSLKEYVFDNKLLQNACIISVNFIYDQQNVTFYFFSNAKRLSYAVNEDGSKMIITSNLINDAENAKYAVSRNELVYHDDVYCDDSTLMLLNLLKKLGQKNIFVAGFDGFDKWTDNFYDQSLERNVREYDYDSKHRKKILYNTYSDMDITFLTPSVYDISKQA